MNKELEEAVKKIKEYYEDGEFSLKVLKPLDIILNYTESSIPKEKVGQTIKKIEQYEDIANELIEARIIIADSDSLNFGRKQAHRKDIEELKMLLEE